MKRITLFIAFISMITFGLFSCSKEYSVENLSINTPALGTLPTDSTGLCNNAYVNGYYYVGNSLSNANYALVYVNVATIGEYNISTNTMNGMYFKDSGYFNNMGIQQIELKGYGIPLVPDTTLFTFSFGNSTCNFVVNNITDTSDNAYFKLVNSKGVCSNIAVSGTYTAGTATNNSNYIIAQVNVINTGNYTISTDTKDGFSYTSTGVFSQTGIQSISIPAVGTPLTKGTNTFSLISNSGACTFPVTIK